MTTNRVKIDNASSERIITQLDSLIDIDRANTSWIRKIMLDELWQSILSSKYSKYRTLVYVFCLCNITAIGLLWLLEDSDTITYATTILVSPILMLIFVQCAVRLFTQMKYCKPRDKNNSYNNSYLTKSGK